MDWEIVTWGLLIGIVGMAWMLVLAILNDRNSRNTPEPSSNGSREGSAACGQNQRDAA